MSGHAGSKKDYLPVFEGFPEVTGFFSLKSGAVEGSPYDNQTVFRQLDVENAVRVFPKQIHKKHVAMIRQEDVEAAVAAAASGTSAVKHAGIPFKASGTSAPDAPEDNSRSGSSGIGDVIETGTAASIIVPDTDGTITNIKNVLLTTVHADCLAVFCYDPVKEAIGLSHAGWRGTCAGIAVEMIEKMQAEYDCDTNDLQVYIGPGISRCCFEAGMEVAAAFAENWAFAHEFISRTPEDLKNEKCHIDIKGINRRQLELAGVPAEQIKVSEHCTCCEPELFCSYRREGGTYMRMGGGLCMPAR